MGSDNLCFKPFLCRAENRRGEKERDMDKKMHSRMNGQRHAGNEEEEEEQRKATGV